MLHAVPKKNYWISSAVLLFVLVISIVLYYKANQKLAEEYEDQVHTVGSLALTEFERTVRNNIKSLEHLRDRIEESDGAFMNYFESDANRIIAKHSALKFIEWIDKDGIIQRITPLEGNTEALFLDIKKIGYRYDEWITNSLNDKTNITPWVALTQKGEAFLIDIPIFVEGEFYGTVTAGMDFKKQFNAISESLQDHAILIRDETGAPFYGFNNPKPSEFPDDRIFSSQLRPISNLGESWDFQLLYSDNALYKERNFIQKAALIFGLVLSVITSLLVFFFLKSRHDALVQETNNTRLSKLNQELIQQKKAAQLASSAKSDFLSNMSHEIRTPLNAILGFTDILQTKNLLKKERLYLNLMRNSAQTLLGLVNDILDIDKIESGKMEIRSETFKPSDRLQKVLTTYYPQLKEQGLELHSNISVSSKISVKGDASKFDQIATNLITNAIKFTPSGSITIDYNETVIDKKVHITYTVKDTGVGIPKQKLDNIFERFIQLENGTRKKHEGGGLGLSITRELVGLLNGTIDVESELHLGTSFTVSLPFEVSEAAAEPIPKKIQKNLSHISCLIVDDNRINRMILYNILLQTGIKSESVSSGVEALEKVKQRSYDVVFMDIHMPEMDGFETATHILQLQEDVAIIGLSADVTVEAVRRGKLSGMVDYLTKPINKTELFAALQRLTLEKSVLQEAEAEARQE
ncbi:response regulator [Candidatus Ulvibacter alkanivorans]|uniref:response regulator n=1 Tax=Candidatus Ulvibacter alkanivorans TaxID=2267620 RepID=UPI000DF2C918|nr:response regulator [Candidatus Ulvibacter alkanivorans]